MADKKTKKIKVYLAIITHRHGENVYAGGSRNELLDKLHNFVAQYWDEMMGGRQMPRSKKAAVSQYFDVAKEKITSSEFLDYAEDTIEVPA